MASTTFLEAQSFPFVLSIADMKRIKSFGEISSLKEDVSLGGESKTQRKLLDDTNAN